ncbi:hypothetical protein Tco_1250860, partial [Tanacetum coccineum]
AFSNPTTLSHCLRTIGNLGRRVGVASLWGLGLGSISRSSSYSSLKLIIGLGLAEVEARYANGVFLGVIMANTVVITGGLSLVVLFGICGGVEKPGGGVISLPFVMPEKLRRDRRVLAMVVGLPRTVYHGLYHGGKALVEEENVGFDLARPLP